MASLIESLVETPLVRQDNRRMSVTKRPTPLRLREVLEVFGALGNAASMQGLTRSVDIRSAEPKRSPTPSSAAGSPTLNSPPCRPNMSPAATSSRC